MFLEGLESFYDVFDGFYRAFVVFSMVFLCVPGVLEDFRCFRGFNRVLEGLEAFYDVFDEFYRAFLVFSRVFLCFPGAFEDFMVFSMGLSCFWRIWRFIMMFSIGFIMLS